MFFLAVPSLHTADRPVLYLSPYPYSSSALNVIPKVNMLILAEPIADYFPFGSPVPHRESYSITIDKGPPWDSSFSPRERAATGASVSSPFKSVSAALNAAAAEAVPSRVRENECIHNNLKGSGRVLRTPSDDPEVGLRLVPGNGLYVIGKRSFPKLKQEGPSLMNEGSIGVWKFGSLKVSRLYYGDFQSTSSPGAILSKSSVSTSWVEWDKYTTGVHNERVGRHYGGWGPDTCGLDDFSVSHINYDGGWGKYTGGDDYWYGGFVKAKFRGVRSVNQQWGTNKLRVTWSCELIVEQYRYRMGGETVLHSRTTTPSTLYTYAYPCHSPNSPSYSLDPGPEFWRLKVLEAEGHVRMVQSHAPQPNHSSLIVDTMNEDARALSSNNVENLAQLRNASSFLPAGAIVDCLTGKTAKGLASLYLWYRYVYRPAVKDYGEFRNLDATLQKLTRPGNRVARKGRSSSYSNQGIDVSIRDGAKIVYSIHNVQSHQYNPFTYGLHAGLGQAWDIVPFSFVADWFLGIADVLGQLDFVLYRNLFSLKYIIVSRKMESEVTLARYGPMEGNALVTSYFRGATVQWPQPELTLNGRPVAQWWAAGLSLAILFGGS